MLKKISVDQVRVGMHLQALEGAWLDHPFWSSSFVIADLSDLRKLRQSNVREVWIDLDKGLDVAGTEDGRARPQPWPAMPAMPAIPAIPVSPGAQADPASATPATPPTHSISDELPAAALICNRGNQAMQAVFREVRLGHAISTEGCQALVQEISASVHRNRDALISLARLRRQDEYSYMHSMAVCVLMVALSREAGLDEQQSRTAGLAGLLHDLGKAVMPAEVLKKPGPLTPEEFGIIRSHPARGHTILLEGHGVGPDVLDACLHHHERIDGSGYPHGLVGDGILQLARMVAICDVYDAVSSDRVYKRGWCPGESIARMATWKGHFDPDLFQYFVKSVGIYPVGALVRLESDRLAVVLEQNPDALTTPVVKVFFSTRSQQPVPVQRVDLATGSDRIVGRETPDKWGFKHLDTLWSEQPSSRRH